MSMPLAATSVHIRNLTSPSLNDCNASLLSCMLLAPARTRQLYGFSKPFSIFPRKPFPPPKLLRNFSTRSQSKLVLQKIKHWSMSSSSMMRFSTRGLSLLTASERQSLLLCRLFGPGDVSKQCTLSVQTSGFFCNQDRSSSGSTSNLRWWTVSGTECFPLRSTQIGFWQSSSAILLMASEWRVAENMRHCSLSVPLRPALGMRLKRLLTIFLVSPSSTKRSASSRT
mmetsp:Transcript_6565/g.16719  ORF Transcript_6565/g.16719 Transcript_6565/m.16719 type:complete len:226 (-) Transcript_6565:1049-1726(-)